MNHYLIIKLLNIRNLITRSPKMHQTTKLLDPLQRQKRFNMQIIVGVEIKPKPINVSLTSNPFFRDQQDFHYLSYMLNQYNKRVVFTTKGVKFNVGKQKEHQPMNLVNDRYQIMSYERMHTLLCDLSQMQSKQDQIEKLSKLAEWFRHQDQIICQRRDQGSIRYRVDKQWRDWQREQQEKYASKATVDQYNPENISKNIKPKDQEIPSQLIARLMGPYWTHSRSIHKQFETPDSRLYQYKRKIINIATFIEEKQEQVSKHARVLYPMPTKIQQPKEQQLDQNHQQLENSQNQEGGQQNIQNPQGKPLQNQIKKQDANDQQQDLGFGQEKQEGAEDDQPGEEQQADDKLAPKHKIYTAAITPPSQKKRKYYKASYLFYKGEETPSERAMEIRYVKMQQDKLKKQKEQNQIIQLAHQWGKGKSKLDKQLQRKLQEMTFKPKYSLAFEEPPKIERLNPQDQAKYGLNVPVKKQSLPNYKQIDLTGKGSYLPSIELANSHGVNQRSIKKDRLKSLKNKFGKMLNLSEYEQRETAPSMCQYTSRRRDFSQIIKAHSKSKERINQLEQVMRLKEKMTRGKLGVNMKALSLGLVLPQDEQKPSSMVFPSKQLPNNPFWIEPVKKKKKK